MENNVNERIKLISEQFFKGNVSAMARAISIKQATLRDIISEKVKPSYDTIKQIVEYTTLSVNADWLITGRGKMQKVDMADTTSFTYYDDYVDGAIPYYKNLPVSAGQMGLSTFDKSEKPVGWIKMNEVFSSIGAFPVVGCSMEPSIRPGDFIAVSPMYNWDRIDPDKTYMILTHEDRMIKHLVIDNDDPDILWCISPNYPKFKIAKCEILAIWRITFHGRIM